MFGFGNKRRGLCPMPCAAGLDLQQRAQLKASFHVNSLLQICSVYFVFSVLL
jgi:hypothetical protein